MSTTAKNPTFATIVSTITTLDDSERETLEVLLDKEFAQTVLERGKELNALKKNGGLLSIG
jgi:hypothetical protein